MYNIKLTFLERKIYNIQSKKGLYFLIGGYLTQKPSMNPYLRQLEGTSGPLCLSMTRFSNLVISYHSTLKQHFVLVLLCHELSHWWARPAGQQVDQWACWLARSPKGPPPIGRPWFNYFLTWGMISWSKNLLPNCDFTHHTRGP